MYTEVSKILKKVEKREHQITNRKSREKEKVEGLCM